MAFKPNQKNSPFLILRSHSELRKTVARRLRKRWRRLLLGIE